MKGIQLKLGGDLGKKRKEPEQKQIEEEKWEKERAEKDTSKTTSNMDQQPF